MQPGLDVEDTTQEKLVADASPEIGAVNVLPHARGFLFDAEGVEFQEKIGFEILPDIVPGEKARRGFVKTFVFICSVGDPGRFGIIASPVDHAHPEPEMFITVAYPYMESSVEVHREKGFDLDGVFDFVIPGNRFQESSFAGGIGLGRR
jgi:hypothetical protein